MIRIYTMDECPYCKELKDLCTKEGIKFDEIDIHSEENKVEVDKVFELTKVDSVPIAKVGNQLLAPDVSFTSIEEAFDIIKELLEA